MNIMQRLETMMTWGMHLGELQPASIHFINANRLVVVHLEIFAIR